MTLPSRNPAKLAIQTDTGSTVVLHYTPNDIGWGREAEWSEDEEQGASSQGLSYEKTSPKQLTFTAFLNDWMEPGVGGGRPSVENILDFMDTLVDAGESGQPPVCVVSWGAGGGQVIQGICKNYKVANLLLDMSGNPIRGEVALTFEAYRLPAATDG